jgi:hypothetical protein
METYHMLRLSRFGFFVCAVSALIAGPLPSPDASTARASAVLAQLPLRFEANQGQTDPEIRYTARAAGYTLLLTDRGPTLALPGSGRVALSLLNSNRTAPIEALDRSRTRINYLVGNRANWRGDVPSYSRVRYRGVYPGVDVVYYGNRNQLEFDFVLEPGADPKAIRLRFSGASRVSISPEGDLVVEARGARILQKKPLLYQDETGTSSRRSIAGRYAIISRNVIGFRVDAYDRSRRLVIDPTLTYSSYIGGNGTDQVNAVKLTSKGLLYIAGNSDTGALPAAGNSYNTANTGGLDIFVAIIDTTAAGNFGLTYLTYLGGTLDDIPLAMDVDAAGFIYLTGTSTSVDFPLANGPFQSSGSATAVNSYVVKLDPTAAGSDGLVYSSYLGGTTGPNTGNGIAVDARGLIYVIGTTQSSDFPVTATGYQQVSWGPSDAFLCQIDPNAGALVYSTYLGGEDNDDGRSILIGPNGLVYFTVSTLSTQFPMAAYNYSGTPFGAEDVIVGIMDMTQPGNASLVYSTYFGGSANEEVRSMVFDSKGNLVITGYTLSSDFPVTADALQSSNAAFANGGANAFVAVVNPNILGSGFLIYSTYLGGSSTEVGHGVGADSAGYLYVTGYTLSKDFPTVNASQLQPTWGNGTNVFLTKFRPGVKGLSSINYSTYFGASGTYDPMGLAVAADGTAYVVGYGTPGLPTANATFGFSGGSTDGFILAVGQ